MKRYKSTDYGKSIMGDPNGAFISVHELRTWVNNLADEIMHSIDSIKNPAYKTCLQLILELKQ